MCNDPLLDMSCSQRQHEEETRDRGKMSSQKIERAYICIDHTIDKSIIKISYRKVKNVLR